MQGAVDRSDIYKNVEKTLDALIAEYIDQILRTGRNIRKAEVGEDVAGEEEKRGRKTDEEYAKESAARREERAKILKREKARKMREDEMEELKAKAAKHAKEIEQLRCADQRRKEREALKAERDAKAEERRRRDMAIRDEDEADQSKERQKYKLEEPDINSPTPAPPVDEKALEETALALLLQEGRELAAKNAPKVDPDGSQSPAPYRKPHVSPPKGPAADRHKIPIKPEHRARLGYNGTHIQQGSPLPHPPAGLSHSRSPHRVPSPRHERSQSPFRIRNHSRSYYYRDDNVGNQDDLDLKASHKSQVQPKREIETGSYNARGRDEYGSRSPSRATERDPRDQDKERSKRYDYEYDYDYPRGESRHEERTYTRPRREEAPEHIDRYVPGGAVPSRDKGRVSFGTSGDRDGKERDTKERDYKYRGSDYRASKREYDRSSYHGRRDRGRDRHYDRDRDRDRDRERGGEKHQAYERDRESDRHGERAYVRPRREPNPENIDRYVPAGE